MGLRLASLASCLENVVSGSCIKKSQLPPSLPGPLLPASSHSPHTTYALVPFEAARVDKELLEGRAQVFAF